MILRGRFVCLAVAASMVLAVGCSSGSESDDNNGGSDSGSDGKSGSATIGITSPSMGFLPLLMAADRMNEMGYDITVEQLTDTPTMLQAANDGLIDIVASSSGAGMPAIDAGLDVRIIMERVGPEFNPVGVAGDPCEVIDGGRYGVHSRNDGTHLLAKYFFSEECPDATPQVLVVPGSDVRAGGLLQGQLEAATVDLQDQVRLLAMEPGKFQVMANYIQELPIIGGIVAASPAFLSENEELVKDLINTELDVVADIYADPDVLLTEAQERLTEVDPEILPAIVSAYIDNKLYDPEGGVTDEETQFTIDFFGAVTPFQNVDSPDDVVDRTFLDAVLSER